MPAPTNRMAYLDIYAVFDKALEDPKGIRLPFDNEGEALNYRLRMNSARGVDRRENAQTFDEGDPMHGQSPYDVLTIRLRHGADNTVFLYIEPKDKNTPDIESLSEIEAEDEHENGG